jgi:hypothetical protein
VPIFVLEIVSLTPGGEYEKKLATYAKLGVLYYIVYNPQYWQRKCPTDTLRERHLPLEIYRLVNGNYQLQIGEPFWMPEIGLGIGRFARQFGSIQREVLYWYNESGNRYLTSEEAERQAREQLELAQQQLDRYRQQFGELPE